MYLKSKINLKYNLPIAGQEEGIIIGRILSFEMDGELTQINASYDYSVLNGEEATTIVRGKFEANGEDLDNLYAYTDANMPTGLTSRGEEQFRRYTAFILEMVETFKANNPDLTIDDIEIVNN